jgi:hypothetical protein
MKIQPEAVFPPFTGCADSSLTARKSRDDVIVRFGGALVSTWEMRQRRHAEDGSLASLKIEPKQTANQELALAA